MGLNYSVNTNANALVALQNLNATQRDLNVTQNRISSGKKIDTAKDNGSTWAIAQNQKSTLISLSAVTDSLDRGKSTVDVALAAGASISTTLDQMRLKALAAKDVTLDTASRAALNDEYVQLRDSITQQVNNADFNGYNMIKATGVGYAALANATGTNTITVAAQNLALGGTINTVQANSTILTAVTAGTELTKLVASVSSVNAALAKMGSQAKRLDNHRVFIDKLKDTLETGIANLVDADLAKESAKLQGLQVKQQLGAQALSIANQAPGILQSLFK